ncbi:MAG: AAA family ATPase [Chitinophagales bacterium]|nr:AAA family ATPase [Chitinophagales bacterium]
MDYLQIKSKDKVSEVSLEKKRYLYTQIPWNQRLIGILGGRGTGKTTLLLQHLKETYGKSSKGLYVSLDDIYFSDNRLYNLATTFRRGGGKALYLDEVHKYPDWSQEIKNLYDDFKDLKIYFTGSSLLQLAKQKGDLSRRALFFYLEGLSFREFLDFKKVISIDAVKLPDLLKNHEEIARQLSRKMKPYEHFPFYIKKGAYPFVFEDEDNYWQRLDETIQLTIENDMALYEGFDAGNFRKMKQLLFVIAANVPFKPNVMKLSDRTGITRNTIIRYFDLLERGKVLRALHASGIGIGSMQKPEKLYLYNTNLAFALAGENTNAGTLRETFFANQLSVMHKLTVPHDGDFMVDGKYTFEVSGKNKTAHQVKNIRNSFVVSDEIEKGINNKIPLWLFGLLY